MKNCVTTTLAKVGNSHIEHCADCDTLTLRLEYIALRFHRHSIGHCGI